MNILHIFLGSVDLFLCLYSSQSRFLPSRDFAEGCKVFAIGSCDLDFLSVIANKACVRYLGRSCVYDLQSYTGCLSTRILERDYDIW